MNTAAVTGMRNFWSLANTTIRTMSSRDMALTTWGKVYETINVDPATGTRWCWNDRYNAFVAYE